MSRFGIGQPVRRIEDVRFITGRGRYVADIDLPGMVHGQVLTLAACARADQGDRCNASSTRRTGWPIPKRFMGSPEKSKH